MIFLLASFEDFLRDFVCVQINSFKLRKISPVHRLHTPGPCRSPLPHRMDVILLLACSPHAPLFTLRHVLYANCTVWLTDSGISFPKQWRSVASDTRDTWHGCIGFEQVCLWASAVHKRAEVYSNHQPVDFSRGLRPNVCRVLRWLQ
jgi:hypothetical protein